MTTATNDLRTRAALKHDSIGTVHFAWDDMDWVIVCFKSRKSISYWLSCGYTLPHADGITVPKEKAREMWSKFVGEGWKEKTND